MMNTTAEPDLTPTYFHADERFTYGVDAAGNRFLWDNWNQNPHGPTPLIPLAEGTYEENALSLILAFGRVGANQYAAETR